MSKRDPYAHLKENAWRESDELDARLASGEIDEETWHREWQDILVPAYLRADTPWQQSGKSGSHDDWVYARALVAHGFGGGCELGQEHCSRTLRTVRRRLRGAARLRRLGRGGQLPVAHAPTAAACPALRGAGA